MAQKVSVRFGQGVPEENKVADVEVMAQDVPEGACGGRVRWGYIRTAYDVSDSLPS